MNCILRNENAIYYACGYSNDNALYLTFGGEAFLITDSRYITEAGESGLRAEVVEARDLVAKAASLIRLSRVGQVVYDPNDWTVGSFEALRKKCGAYLKPVANFSMKQRMIKREEEIEKLAKAAELGRAAFDRLARWLQDEGFGQKESRIFYAAKTVLSDYGTYDLSFDPITAVNTNAAKPHALPDDTVLRKGDLLLVDAGLKYERYCSDRTRTAFAGENLHFKESQRFASAKIQKAYDLVRKAHDAAIAGARTGMLGRQVDALAREVIEKGGMGEYFVHSTGHGVGLDIHEMPSISRQGRERIEAGMVFTIEPGIYIPGEFGIRIEDMVVMKGSGAEIL